MSYTTERTLKVYNDNTGDYVSVGPDGDGLDLVELRQTDAGEMVARISMTHEQAEAFVIALKEYLRR